MDERGQDANAKQAIDPGWRQSIIYRCVVGSRAYGLATDASDSDYRGCFLPPAELHWSLNGVPEQLVDDESQECYWEFEKLIRLGLKSNPNALECLNTSIVEHATPLAEELRAIAHTFPSQVAIGSYLKYADSQFTRLENKEDAGQGINWRHASHLIRLMICGKHLLETGKVLVDVREHRDLLLSIKNAEREWPEIEELRTKLRTEFEAAARKTQLPLGPDTKQAEELLLKARRSMV